MKTPESDGELYSYLVMLFGYGSYDETTSDMPYWQYRRKEVMKVAASRKKAGVPIIEAVRCADYCKAMGVTVTGPHSIYRHLVEARRWHTRQQQVTAEANLDQRINDAVAIEAALPDSPWLDRLVRATGAHREEVLVKWQESRNPRSESPTATSA